MITQVFPPEIVSRSNDQDMLIHLKCGSIWQCIGSDNYDALVGSNPVGVVFSEWSICDPKAWDLVRPILAENGGWALFIYTPRGRNHGYYQAEMARRNPNWFFQTLPANETEVMTPEAIQDERDSGMSEAMIDQEFYCSFEAFNEGAYFGKQLQRARKEKRIGHFPPDPALPVYTFWDLGINDQNAIWLVQATHNEIRLVGYYENSGEAMPHYFTWLRNWADEHDCKFAEHYAPHDIEVREYTTGKTRREVARREHKWNFRVTPALPLGDQIEAARTILPKCFFNETEGQRGIEALASYEREWDEKHQVFRDRPLHNWASHGTSAFMNMAVNFKDRMFEDRRPNQTGEYALQQDWSPFD